MCYKDTSNYKDISKTTVEILEKEILMLSLEMCAFFEFYEKNPCFLSKDSPGCVSLD